MHHRLCVPIYRMVPIKLPTENGKWNADLIVGAGAGAVVVACVIVAIVIRLALFSLTPDAMAGGVNVNQSGAGGTAITFLGFFASLFAICYIAWDPAAREWRCAALYAITVVIVSGFSLANYTSGDTLVPAKFQVYINLVLAFIASISIAMLWPVPTSWPEAIISKYAAIFSLSAFCVAMPIGFTIIYLLLKWDLIPKTDAAVSPSNFLDIGKDIVLLVGSVIGVLLSYLKLKEERSKAEKP